MAGWEPLKQGRIYHVFDPAAAKDPLVAETRKLMAEGMDGRNAGELTRLLAHPDIRVRQAAQFALADKGDVAALAPVAERNESRVARLHAIWRSARSAAGQRPGERGRPARQAARRSG